MANWTTEFFQDYRGAFNTLKYYWSLYGGWRALVRSPYLHIAILLSLSSVPLWWPDKIDSPWYGLVIDVIPNLLGFSLGGYAILLAFGNENFLGRICGKDPDGTPSPYLKINSTFVHFILIQILSLANALVANAWSLHRGWCAILGLALFYYAVLSSFAAALAVFKLADWFDRYIENEESEKGKKAALPAEQELARCIAQYITNRQTDTDDTGKTE